MTRHDDTRHIVRDYVVLWHPRVSDHRVPRCHDILRLYVRTRGMR